MPAVRLIGVEGEQLGVVPTERAKIQAREAETDLVEVSPNANPPVCKLMDYGKYLYSQKKQERKAKQAGKQSEMKGIRISPRIGDHDLQVKAKRANEFLEKKHPIKLELRFKGREITHMDVAKKKIDEFLELVVWGKPEGLPRRQGRQMFVIINPLNKPRKNETEDSLRSEEEGS